EDIFTDQLREDKFTAQLQLSANAMPYDIEKGKMAGFFRYLTKPIVVKEFMDTLNTALAPVPESGELSPAALTRFPAELLEQLREATLAADLDAIMELLQQADSYDRNIADELRALAASYSYQSLLDLFETNEVAQ
ncbi:MAG: hypothetical protein WCJ56_15480, partial [bacterium]